MRGGDLSPFVSDTGELWSSNSRDAWEGMSSEPTSGTDVRRHRKQLLLPSADIRRIQSGKM